ncbi:MAG: phosphotransacetylase family protein [Chloroflexota bacterium]|nr:phosphotransacetylase family protein [Chloroflexota bacterium]
MAALYVVSTEGSAGKSALCAGLGKKLQTDGKKVGYFKPVSNSPDPKDKDAELMRQLLDLKEPVESLGPIIKSTQDLAATAEEKEPTWLKDIEKAYSAVSKGKDVVLIEGLSDLKAGGTQTQLANRIAEALKAKVILVAPYSGGLSGEQIAGAVKGLENVLGVVINAVPERQVSKVEDTVLPSLERSNIALLGILPEDRILLTATVAELAEHVGGSILNSQDRSNELVESVMVGAMSVDSALSYLTLKENKAVITRGDRADIQLAALETSTKCLVLTGNIDPVPTILSRALELDVPIVLVENDTVSTMDALEGAFGTSGFASEKKVARLGQILEQNLDMKAINQAIQG